MTIKILNIYTLLLHKGIKNLISCLYSLIIIRKGKDYKLCVLHNIVITGGLVKVVENYVNKGQEIAVEGKLTNKSYETKQGEKRYVTEILVSELLMLGNK